jgi:hypothetical protein
MSENSGVYILSIILFTLGVIALLKFHTKPYDKKLIFAALFITIIATLLRAQTGLLFGVFSFYLFTTIIALYRLYIASKECNKYLFDQE